MSCTASPPLVEKGIELATSRIAGVAHRNIHILMGMVQLRILTDYYISTREVKTQRDVIDVSLMMVPMLTFNRHRAAHHRRVKLQQLCDEVLGS